jgi:hypothetical protein
MPSEFDFKVIHRPGIDNEMDCLSRFPREETHDSTGVRQEGDLEGSAMLTWPAAACLAWSGGGGQPKGPRSGLCPRSARAGESAAGQGPGHGPGQAPGTGAEAETAAVTAAGAPSNGTGLPAAAAGAGQGGGQAVLVAVLPAQDV